MTKYIFILLCIISYSGFGQETDMKHVKDTIPDFWNHKGYERRGGYNNKVERDNNTILYTKITFPESDTAQFEYFRINDSLYKFNEYFPEDKRYYYYETVKSSGKFLLTDEIVQIDTTIVDMPDGSFEMHSDYFRKITKIDKWYEIEGDRAIAKKWYGVYKKGKRVGWWKQCTYGIGNEVEIKRINYDADSTQSFYEDNKAYNKSAEEIEKLLIGDWRVTNHCNFKNEKRLVFTRCKDCNRDGYEIDDYMELSKNMQLLFLITSCVDKMLLMHYTWKVEERNGQPIFKITASNLTGSLVYKIIYIDDKNVVIERDEN